MPTRTRFVFLMHPKEYKEEKAGTGRLTQLCLPHSELHMGKGFDDHEAVQAVLHDARNYCVLLYPGAQAINLSDAGSAEEEAGSPFDQLRAGREPIRQPQGEPGAHSTSSGQAGSQATEVGNEPGRMTSGCSLQALRSALDQRQLVVFLLDATWSGARKMLRLSPSLQRLPRIMFTPVTPSRYVIKQQPQEGCLSTLESVHELLIALERAGLDDYPQPDQLIAIFHRMQDFQIKCAADPTRTGYRRKPYGDPATRRVSGAGRGARRDNFLRKPAG